MSDANAIPPRDAAPSAPADQAGTTRELFPRVYEELRMLAGQRMRREKPGLTLQTTALVHEVYVRLNSGAESLWDNPRHFFAAAAEAMRRILVERARQYRRIKRGGDRHRLELDPLGYFAEGNEDPDALLGLDEALRELQGFDAALCEVVSLRFFAGMTIDEVALAIGRSPRSVKNDWSVARAWLLRRMEGSGGTP